MTPFDETAVVSLVHRWRDSSIWAPLADAVFIHGVIEAIRRHPMCLQSGGVRALCLRHVSRELHARCLAYAPADPAAHDQAVALLLGYLTRFAARVLDDADAASIVAVEALSAVFTGAVRLTDPDAFLAYCQTAVRRRAWRWLRDDIRRRAREVSLDDDAGAAPDGALPLLQFADPADGPDALCERAQSQHRFWAYVGACPGLSARERRVLMLRYHHGLSAIEIARRLETSRNSVDSACSKACAKLARDRDLLAHARALGYDAVPTQ